MESGKHENVLFGFLSANMCAASEMMVLNGDFMVDGPMNVTGQNATAQCIPGYSINNGNDSDITFSMLCDVDRADPKELNNSVMCTGEEEERLRSNF